MTNIIEHHGQPSTLKWWGRPVDIALDEAGITQKLQNLDQPCYIVILNDRIGVADGGTLVESDKGYPVMASAPAIGAQHLGESEFAIAHNVKFAYMAGSMANGISSVDLVQAMANSQIMSSFGAAGLVPAKIKEAIHQLKPLSGNYAFNLIHSPSEEAIEQEAVDLYLQHAIRTVEASAFLSLTPHIVRYRVAGLSQNPDGSIAVNNRVIAKISRREVATQFMQPPPPEMLRDLRERGWITDEQARLAETMPMADDITVEADSGGHTDNRPLVSLLPSILSLRDEISGANDYPKPIRVGAAGGIGTPTAALAAFMMGAAYVVTGSINQACVEAGASVHTKKLLAEASMTDVMMAPAADMFEMGVKLQVLKRGTFFPMRAQKLYELYRTYDAIEDIPSDERTKLEKQIFRRELDAVWQDTVAYFQNRDPIQITRAEANPKSKMALIFRWYLGLSSRWSNHGEPGREVDYQVWCGPAMGAFNDWVHGSYLENPAERRVVEVAEHLMQGAAYLYRIQHLMAQGIRLPRNFQRYVP